MQLVSMNERINFIGEKFDEFEKDRCEKDEIIKNLSKNKKSEMVQRMDRQIREFSKFSRPTTAILTA